jgi:hypothetical protein
VGCPEGVTPRELCNELRRLGAADQIVVEISFDPRGDNDVYVKTASAGQLHLL